MICLKRHSCGHELLVAACDLELLGKKFQEGDLCIDVSDCFFGGEKVDVRMLLEVLALATIGNLVGKSTVEAAVKAGMVDSECVIWIQGVPHAQIVRM